MKRVTVRGEAREEGEREVGRERQVRVGGEDGEGGTERQARREGWRE